VLLALLLLLLLHFAGIQKLHIRTVPLGEQPRRIAHQPSSRSLGVVTIATPAGASPSESAGTGCVQHRNLLVIHSHSSTPLMIIAHQHMRTACSSLYVPGCCMPAVVETGLVLWINCQQVKTLCLDTTHP
jgi:hypothetical protein